MMMIGGVLLLAVLGIGMFMARGRETEDYYYDDDEEYYEDDSWDVEEEEEEGEEEEEEEAAEEEVECAGPLGGLAEPTPPYSLYLSCL